MGLLLYILLSTNSFASEVNKEVGYRCQYQNYYREVLRYSFLLKITDSCSMELSQDSSVIFKKKTSNKVCHQEINYQMAKGFSCISSAFL